MQISNVSAGYSDPATIGKRRETNELSDTQPGESLRLKETSTAGASAVLGEILGRYDVTDITPAEFTEMLQKLHEAGAITEKELQQLAVIRHDLDLEGMDPDKSIDLLEFYADKIEKTQRRLEDLDGPPAPHQQLGPLLTRLDWIEKFALVQSAPETIGLDTMA